MQLVLRQYKYIVVGMYVIALDHKQVCFLMIPFPFMAKIVHFCIFLLPQSAGSQDDENPELSEADMVIFMGDFNYRLFDVSYDEARDMISQRCFDWLREKDQLRAEMKAGNVFQGMREAQIKFPPTYKFDRHQPGLSGK